MIRGRKNDCQIKDILYPDTKKPKKNFIPNNFKKIKTIEEQNRIKKSKKEEYVERKCK